MLLCDGCGTGWHLYCLRPPLKAVPAGTWLCPRCLEVGVTAPQVDAQVLRERAAPSGGGFLPAAQRRRHQYYATLDGYEVTREYVDPLTMEPRQQAGTVHYLGTAAGNMPFEARYENGTVERMGIRQLRGCLRDEVARGAQDRARRTKRRQVLAACMRGLPDEWVLGNAEGMGKALAWLMPGVKPSVAHVGRLVNRVPGGSRFLQELGQPNTGGPECVATLVEEIEPLFRCVDFGQCSGVLDPWSGTGTVARVLKKEGLPVLRNDISGRHEAERHEDALQPGFYRRVKEAWHYDAIVGSPWFSVLDLTLPLAVCFAPLVAFHVPGDYVTNAPPIRREYLRALQGEGRLALLVGLPRGRVGRRCLWLVVFASRALRERLLRIDRGLGDPWVLT